MAKYNNHLKDILNWDNAPKNEPIQLYDNDGTLICDIDDELKFAWIRTQIAKHQIEGCYIMRYHNKFNIDKDGKFPCPTNGVLDAYAKQLAALYFAQNGAELKCDEKSNLIDINNCPQNEYVKLFDNENKLICETNSDLEFDWVRARIKELGLKGCYLIFRGERIEINEYGCPLDYPTGMFDNHINALCDLV